MSDKYVTRGELILQLKKWQQGELSTQQMWDWASHRFVPGAMDYDDWEDDSSVAHEVLSTLDSLDMHFVLVEDAPIHLAFLATPWGEFAEGYRHWRQAQESIDYQVRREQLRHDAIYAPFCK